jgi:pimeloyl-ACP methyl ester carboxylesterase
MQKTNSIQIKDYSIFVRDRPGSAPTILFVHGNSMSSKVWQKQFESDILAPYHLIALDLPGHGESSHSRYPDRDYNLPVYGAVLKQLIEALNLSNYIIVSHSLGGHTVVEVLPELNTCKGVFTGSPPLVVPFPADRLFLPHPILGSFFKGDVTDEEIALLSCASLRKDALLVPDFLAEDFRKTDPQARVYVSKSIGEGKFVDEVELLKSVTIPIGLFTGMEEQLINNHYYNDLELVLWRGAVQNIPLAGHLPQWENPSVFNQLLADFVRDCL